MIADTERLIDGFRGLPAGMDGSKEPPQTPSEAAWYATNVTFRGGNGPKTRPGFREIPPTYWRNPQPVHSPTITISSGVATATVSGGHGYDNKDKVTIAGASPSGVNSTHVITRVNSTTFTFPTTATGTVTGTITSRRDVDAAYQDDFIDGDTSRGRVLDIIGALLIQGVIIYQDPREGNPAQMIIVADGKIYALNFENASCYLLNSTDEISADVPVYMTQAEKYLIIQTGRDEPRIYDGYLMRRVSYYGSQVIPIGKQMAYGQGRLFVAVNEGAEIIASDLVFGGSTTNVAVTSSSAANPTVITTPSTHGLVAGDQVTIQGHSSTPPINSTYTVATAPTTTTFTIPVAVTSAGGGGFVSRFNAGQDSDLLRFTENTFLNEGGSFAPTGKVGRITGLVFLPVQDTSTGQGDLIAFCERGAVTFQVSAPRDQWKSLQGFQRVLLDNIGSTSDSIIPVNGDLFFRSREGNGIRTYRNARAEAEGYGLTPMSAEIDPVLEQDTLWMLDGVTFATFDNRLLMTCLPKQYPRRAVDQDQADEFAAEPIPTLYDGIAVLDFQSVSAGRGKSAAVFDGVWTGLRIYKLLQGTFDGDPRCFAVCLHEDETGRRNEIWEMTRNDEYDTPIEGARVINSSIVTKAYDFENNMSLKKLLRCDLWFDDIGGGPDNIFTCSLAYRPDDYPNFTAWQTFERNFVTQFLTQNDDPLPNYERGYAPQVRFPTPPRTANLATDVPAYLGHDFTLRVEWAGHARLGRLMLHGQKVVEAVNGGTL